MPAAAAAGSIYCRRSKSGFTQRFKKAVKLALVVVFAVYVDIDDSKASRFADAAAEVILWMNTSSGLENFSVSQPPALVFGRQPGISVKRLIYVAVTMEKRQKFSGSFISRKIFLACKSSWRARFRRIRT